MDEMELLQSMGGVPVMQGVDVVSWNFGVIHTGEPEPVTPTLYSALPRLMGAWDGQSTVNHHVAARQVLGRDLEPHQQPRGTCGGRAFSRGNELLQLVMIAAGKRAAFKPVSHAWGYFLARRKWNMLDGRGDGVASGSIPPVMAEYGLLTRDEAGDPLQAGPRSDDVAAAWGAGRIAESEVRRLEGLARDNLVTTVLRCHTAQELADGLASGGVGICSDAQGYTLTRDSEGCCRPSGTWFHYHCRSGVRVLPSGKKVFQYDQSWGPSVPGGPLLDGCPSNVFGVDWDVQDRLCRSGHAHVILGFQLWELQEGPPELTWVF